MRNNRFVNRGNGAVFNCFTCGRRTRENDAGGTGNCRECYEIAGIDNMVNDNGYEPGTKEYADALAECETLLAVVAKRGGNAERVKGLNTFIWRE